jgi:hypothetical protein
MTTFKKLVICIGLAMQSQLGLAAERPTLVKTCDPRPDILPRPIYENSTEYRAQYNRPRYLTGWMAFEISRTSQEAMVWEENYCAGNYDRKHMPPVCKSYMYPKPWEMLNTGARHNPQLTPDFRQNSMTYAQEVEQVEPPAESTPEAVKKSMDSKNSELLVPSPSNRP